MGAIRSAAMMLEWLGDKERALRIEDAVLWSLDQGLTTPDLGGNCKTEEVTEAITGRLKAPGMMHRG